MKDEWKCTHELEIKQLHTRIASLEAGREADGERIKQLRKGLEQAVLNLEPLHRNDACRWATMDVAQNYAAELVAPFRAILAATAQKGEEV